MADGVRGGGGECEWWAACMAEETATGTVCILLECIIVVLFVTPDNFVFTFLQGTNDLR